MPRSTRISTKETERQESIEITLWAGTELWSPLSESYDLVVTRIQDCRPVASIIDVSQAPDRGIAAASAVRSDPATRAVPIVFIGASKVVDQVKAAVPDAIFASRSALDYLLGELAGR